MIFFFLNYQINKIVSIIFENIPKFQVEVSHLLKFMCYLIYNLSSIGLTMSWGMVSAISRVGQMILD